MVDLINWTNGSVTDLGQIPGLANTASGGSFWVGILYMVWIILLLILSVYGLETALLVSSFLGLILGLLLLYGGLIGLTAILPFIGIILLTFLYLTYQKSRM